MVGVVLGCLLQQIVEEETDGRQSLDGSDEELLKALSTALRVALAELEECVEARLRTITAV